MTIKVKKIALINGSPKAKDSASADLLKNLSVTLASSCEVEQYHFKSSMTQSEEIDALFECDAWVFAFPLYVDGVPSQLLQWMAEIEKNAKNRTPHGIVVYAMVNNGFYEGIQSRAALEIMSNWCARAGLIWAQGLGIGAGGMLAGLSGVPAGKGPKKNLGLIMDEFVPRIQNAQTADNIFFTMNLPRFAYKTAAEFGFRSAARKNKLRRVDLNRKLS